MIHVSPASGLPPSLGGYLRLIAAWLVAAAWLHAGEVRLTPAMLDVPLQPPPVDVTPGPQYSDGARDYAMVIGFDRTPQGRLWAAWVAGGDSDKGYFVAASSDDDGETWSPPRLVIDPPDLPSGLRCRTLVGNFWTDPLGRLWLFHDQSLGYFDGRAGVWAIRCDNPDDAMPRWSEPVRLWHGSTLNKPLVLGNGEWLLPVSLWTRDKIRPPELKEEHHDLDELRMANVLVSTDQGRSWTRRGGVFIPEGQFDEHMMAELRDGRIWLLARTTTGSLAESYSSDQGRTWTAARPSSIKHINSRFHIRRLASGRLLLVKHGWIDERTPARSHLRAFLSEDDGKTWRGGLLLDERKVISYPDGFQAPDGMIHVIYDRNRAADREILMARFTEEDVLAGDFVSPRARSRMLVSKALGPTIP